MRNLKNDPLFCPKCGNGSFIKKSYKEYQCESSAYQFIIYKNVAAAVGVIIVYNEKIVMTVRAKNPGKNLLDLPGGFVDKDENYEEAAKREVKEELNIELANLAYLCSAPNTYLYKNIEYRTLDSIFVSYQDSIAEINIDKKEIDAYKLVSLEDLNSADIAFPSIRAGIQVYCELNRQKIGLNP